MSVPLRPLPHPALDPLTTGEVAAALGMSERSVLHHALAGRFPGAFQTPVAIGHSPGGMWRIPHDAALAVGKEMGVWDE